MSQTPETHHDIHGFQDSFRWLSNFHLCAIEYNGLVYRCTENAYQAAKLDLAKNILAPENFQYLKPYMAKRLGKEIVMRKDWYDVRDGIMLELQRSKFKHTDLAEKLLQTGNCLIEETNYWGDCYWGVHRGLGLNRLGTIIMQVRE